MNITKLLITAFFINRLRWLLLGTASNRRHSEKNLRHNSKENILRNSFSVDIEVYALQLKQKSTTGVFHGVLWNFRTVTFDNKPWGGGGRGGLLLKRKQRRRGVRSELCEIRFSLFQGRYLLSHETYFLIFFSTILTTELFCWCRSLKWSITVFDV